MTTDQNELEIVDLGVASEATQGLGLVGIEPQGHPRSMGITDAD